MPIIIKTNSLNYKNNSGEFEGFNAIQQTTTAEQIAEINTNATNAINAIESKKAEAVTQIANAVEVQNMITEIFDSTKNYNAGDYVIHEDEGVNKLYRFTAGHAAGAWTGSDAVEVELAGEVGELKSHFDTVFDEIVSPNVFNGNLSTGFINMSGVVNSSADYSYTDIIPVSSTTFAITADSATNDRRLNVPCRYITAYDSEQNVLSAYSQQNVGSDNSYIDTSGVNVITLDQNVKFIVISIYKPNAKYKNVSVSFDTTVTEYIPYGSETKIKDAILSESKRSVVYTYLHGKTLAVFGDSIMYGVGGTGVGDILAEKYGMTLKKYCVSGATMGVRTDDPSYTVDEAHHIAKQVRTAIAANITPDLIVFDGGINDIGGQIPIGAMTEVYTEPLSESYFADGFETVAYLLMKNFVGVPMIYMRAHNVSSRTYTGQIDYGELGNRIAEKWGIRTVDMYKRMNTQLAEYRTAYLADYTHPNADGYNKYYIPAIEDFVFSELAN